MTRLLQRIMKPVLPVSRFAMVRSLSCGAEDTPCATQEAGARRVLSDAAISGSSVVDHRRRQSQGSSTLVWRQAHDQIVLLVYPRASRGGHRPSPPYRARTGNATRFVRHVGSFADQSRYVS